MLTIFDCYGRLVRYGVRKVFDKSLFFFQSDLLRIFQENFMLTIRFNRVGRRNHAQYRIVVQEHSVAPGGRHLAVVGSYDPHTKKAILKKQEILKWISNGAQPSDTVHNLLLKQQIIVGQKKRRKGKLPKPSEEKTQESANREEEGNDKKSDKSQDDSSTDEKEVKEEKEEKEEK